MVSRKVVTPAKAGAQRCTEKLDFSFRQNDEAMEAENPL